MDDQDLSRRALLKGGGAALAGLSVLQVTGPAHAFPGHPDDDVAPWDDERPDPRGEYPGQPGEEVIPWDDQPEPAPFPGDVQLVWEELDSRLIPNDEFMVVSHYGNPDPPFDVDAWRLGIDGLVAHPQSLSLADLKARRRREVEFTIECSGNTGLPFAIGAIGNARWAGAQLAPLLEEAGVLDEATEVVFWGADRGRGDDPGQRGNHQHGRHRARRTRWRPR